ncbi:MAG: hypothetical protein HZA51_12165 [Planctomycetes bacterium]|nr:hypothetical protein [Planctomycetota bacterium]
MFLTLEDPRAKIQGSRDPLGVQPLWSAFGRHVVTNLTTQSTSIRGFTTLLLGRYFGHRLIEERKAGEEDALAIFLRTEQACAYARFICLAEPGEIRGIERVSVASKNSEGTIKIGNDFESWIMSDQKTYGLWGLYSVPARVSGLIPDGTLGVAPRAMELIEEHYLPILKEILPRLLNLLLHGGTLSARKNDSILKVLSKILGPLNAAEHAFYASALRDSNACLDQTAAARQKLLASLLQANEMLDTDLGREEILAIAKHVHHHDPELGRYLRRIVAMEAFLAPAESFFEYLQYQHNQSISKIAGKVAKNWGRPPHMSIDDFKELLAEIESVVGPDLASLMSKTYRTLDESRFKSAIHDLLDWNRLVMHKRRAAPWILHTDGRLEVRYRGAEQSMTGSEGWGDLWRNSYFLPSLQTVARQLSNGATFA